MNTRCAATDRRREGGERTRRRLLDAARALLAERGEGGVTLREITEAADANVAAVSYHFGSLGALCRATIEEALATLIDESVDRLRALGEEATLDEIAAALAKPLITALGDAGCAERSFLRIMARVAGSPPPELDEWMRAAIARSNDELLVHVRRALPGVPDDDLRFRMECATGMLNSLASGRLRVALEDPTAAELERLFIPVLSGALAAGSPPRVVRQPGLVETLP